MDSNHFNLLVAFVLSSLMLPVYALTGDADKPIKINAENQSLDLQGNVATFTTHVIITQGSIKITADKVVMNRVDGDNKKIIFTAFGAPTTFYQMQDNGKPIQGRANKLKYIMDQDFIELTGNAHVQQLDSNIEGERITYLVRAQQLQAFSQSKDKRVTTILMPSQLQNKNRDDNTKTP